MKLRVEGKGIQQVMIQRDPSGGVRTILHMDLDAFFCSVELLRRPELKGKPFVVGGRPEVRGVVSSASYPARKYGIRSAMPMARALRLCPDLLILSGDHRTYRRYSDMVMEALQQRVSLTQQVSIDEAFLDVTLDPVPGVQIARELQLLIKERYQLPTSWGIASNKLVAKIASEVGKPEGLIEVKPGQEAQFLQPLPVGMLWGVGPKTQGRLASIGIKRIGELAEAPVEVLRGIFGDRGMELAAKAKGMDSSPVKDEREPKSLSNENTFAEDIQDKGALRRELLRLSDRVASRLRKAGYSGRTVKLKIRWSDFTTMTRQATLQHPTDLDREIFETAWTLFHQVWKGDPVRLLGVGVVDLSPTARQLTLFEREHEREGKLLQALDDIRTRFGRDSVQRADQVSDQGNVEDEVDSQS